MTHGWPGVYHGLVYGALTLIFFGTLWRWRQWYVTTPDDARARRSLRAVAGVALLFVALWLTCGRVSMAIGLLQWVIPPVALAAMAALAAGGGPGPQRQQARGPGARAEPAPSGGGERSGPPPATEVGRPA